METWLLLAAGGGVALLVVLLIVLQLRSRAAAASNSVLLLGAVGAGKTVLFHRLLDDAAPRTCTSMRENEGYLLGDGQRRVHVVDVPGHARLRPLLLRQFVPVAGSIVFVVDAVNFRAQLRASAELLYELLTESSLHKRRVPVLVACAKSDIITAVEPAEALRALVAELDKLRKTRQSAAAHVATTADDSAAAAASGAGGDGAGGAGSAVQLGGDAPVLSVKDIENPLSAVAVSAKDGDVAAVLKFIAAAQGVGGVQREPMASG